MLLKNIFQKIITITKISFYKFFLYNITKLVYYYQPSTIESQIKFVDFENLHVFFSK